MNPEIAFATNSIQKEMDGSCRGLEGVLIREREVWK